jgi:GcrA cell cycle regulator
MTSTPWTDDRVAAVTQLWAAGLSASQIAAQLGVTRNAVIGKLHRLGLLGSRPRSDATRRITSRPRAPSPRRRARRPKLATSPPCAEPEGPGEVDRLERLGPRQCRWPIGDPRAEDFSFCGRRTETGPYCPAHRAVAFRPAPMAAADGCGAAA